MNKKCPKCGLVNYLTSQTCVRCGNAIDETENISSNRGFNKSVIAKRASVCLAVLLATVLGFYTSLLVSADRLGSEQAFRVKTAIEILEQKGFTDEVFLLRHIAVFRGNDNWLNASVEKENAYAATNFPFEIVTLYPDFFTYPADDTERAAILLHEAKHLQGKNEKEAYEYVWKNRKRLGWTADLYSRSVIWLETRKLTKEYSPSLFVCDFNEYGDCTEM
jgi:phage FluMu protein Com